MARPRSIDRTRVAALIRQSLTDAQIAARLGCTASSVHLVRKEIEAERTAPSEAGGMDLGAARLGTRVA